MKKIGVAIAGVVMGMAALSAAAEDEKAYKDGPVTVFTYVKVKPGKFDAYMQWLDNEGKSYREAEIKAGILLSYHIYSCIPRNPHDADLILASTYPNMAALDRGDEEDAIAAKVIGSRGTQNKGAESRESLREILGSEIVREQILK